MTPRVRLVVGMGTPADALANAPPRRERTCVVGTEPLGTDLKEVKLVLIGGCARTAALTCFCTQ
jgi:hypothetical protein